MGPTKRSLALAALFAFSLAGCGSTATPPAAAAAPDSDPVEPAAPEPQAERTSVDAADLFPAAPAPVANEARPKEPDVVFLPTPQEAVDKMIEMAKIKRGEKVYDLGCGDGRIVITAAKKHGVTGIGVDIDPERVADSQANVKAAGVEQLVTIREADIFETDFSDADVVTLYLLPRLNVKLMPQLRKLKPGTRIISFDFDMEGATPAETYEGRTAEGRDFVIYKWVVPWAEDR